MAACITMEGELLLPTPKVDGIIEAGPDGPRMLLLIATESLDTGMKFVTGTCLKIRDNNSTRSQHI